MVQANNKMFLKALVLCSVLGAEIAIAAPKTDFATTGTSVVSSNQSSLLSRLSLDSGFEYSQRVAKDEAAKREESMDITLAPAFKLNESLKLSGRLVFSKENTGSQETQVSDTSIGLALKGYALSPQVRTLHSLSVIIPSSYKSREDDRLQSAVGISNGLHYSSPLLDVTYRLGFTELFHEYNVNAAGSANVQRSLSNSLNLVLKATEKFYISTLGVYRVGRTYGNKERSSFEVHADLNYDVMDKMTLNLGTSNAGQALKANGVTSNISAYDEDKAVIRAGISISL